jgi:GxxExxY protein
MTRKNINDLSFRIIGCAIEVHRQLGPGLLESVYERCMLHELESSGLYVIRQQFVPVKYKGIELEADLRLDLLVEDQIIVELKAVDIMLPIFEAQLLTYMKLLDKPKGLLINFNTTNISKEGVKSMVNELFASLSEV